MSSHGRRLILLTMALTATVPACAPKTIPPPPPIVTPKYPEFMFPTVPDALASRPAAQFHHRGWAFLQNGDLDRADTEFSTALRLMPAFYPSEAGLGYVNLANAHEQQAVSRFDRALERAADYVPALVGRGEALLALKRDEAARASYEAALAVSPDLPLVRARVEVLRSRTAQDTVAAARDAARSGNFDEARQAYARAIDASPESPFLYRELGVVQRRLNDAAAALASFRKAVELDPTDARSHLQISELLEASGDVDGAIAAAEAALRAEPTEAIQVRLDALRARAELSRLPAEYRAIPQANPITRGELAALIGVRLDDLLLVSRRREGVVITDTRNHWATPWIMAVARAGVIEVYPNHTFQPSGPVRRGDLAGAVSRLLTLVAQRRPAAAREWQNARRRIADVSPSNLGYPAVSVAVASGVLPLFEGDTFQMTKPVSGAEAVAAIDRIEALAKK
jgi:tetratricopeptide (TPR) repeat protein